MKIRHYIILFLLFSLSCSNHKQDNSLTLFEKPFSKEDIVALNEAITIFDSLIMAKFPPNNSLENSYKTFLDNFCNPDSNHNVIYQDTLTLLKLYDIFKSSGLENEIRLSPQTLKFIDNGIYRKFVYQDEEDQIYEIEDTLLTPTVPENIDPQSFDIFEFLKKKRQLYSFNVFGAYSKALDNIEPYYPENKNLFSTKSNVSFGKSRRKMTGLDLFHFIACDINYSGVKLSDPTIKRILLIEFLY